MRATGPFGDTREVTPSAPPRPARTEPRTRRHWWQPVTGSGAGVAASPGSTVPFAALTVFIVISLTAPQAFVPALASLRIALLTAVVAIVSLLMERVVQRRPLLTPCRETWCTACLAAWAVASLPFSYWPGGSMALLLDTYVKTLAAFWLLGTAVDTLARVRVVAWTVSLAAVPLALTGIRNFIAGVFIPVAAHPQFQRIIGYDAPLTENPNDLALVLNLILPLSVGLLLTQRGRGARLLLGGAALLDVLAVVVTFSRAGFLTLATTFALYGSRLSKRWGRGWTVAVVVMALAATPLLPSGYLNRLGTITSMSDASAQERWRDMIAAASFVWAHPIVGAGVGMNAYALNEERGPFWKVVHDVYLQLAVDLGFPGLILFLVLLFGTIRGVGLVRRRATGKPGVRDLFHLAEGLQISLIAFAVGAVFYPVAYNFYFYYLAGLAVALKAIDRAREAEVDRPPVTERGAEYAT